MLKFLRIFQLGFCVSAVIAHLISFYVLLGGVESGYSRAGFRIQETGPNTMRRRDGSLSYTRMLDLPLQSGEAFQVRLGEISAQENRKDQRYREVLGRR